MVKLKAGLVCMSILALAGYAAYKRGSVKRSAYNNCKTKEVGNDADCGFCDDLSLNNDNTFSDNFGDSVFDDFNTMVDVPMDDSETIEWVTEDWTNDNEDVVEEEVTFGKSSFDTEATNIDSWWESTESNQEFGKTEGNTDDNWGSFDNTVDDLNFSKDKDLILGSCKNIVSNVAEGVSSYLSSPFVKNIRRATMKTFRNVLHTIDTTLENSIKELN